MTGRRLESVDLLRGIVMILMALDHTRDFLGARGISPTNLEQASAGLFLTRWITHFCAPVFFLLVGTGASLALPLVYLSWVLVVIAMYPLCAWFAGLKRRRKGAWLSYI